MKDLARWLTYYSEKGFLVRESDSEESIARSAVEELRNHLVATPLFPAIGFTTGTACNFECTYCMSNRMAAVSDDSGRYKVPFQAARAIAVVQQHCDSLFVNGITETSIGFSGGEPLLHWPEIQKVIEFCRREYRDRMTIRIHINTNASLVTAEMAESMRLNEVIPSISLDGYEPGMNDAVRQYKARSESTFKAIMQGIGFLRAAGLVVDGVYLTLTDKNSSIDPEGLVEFLRLNDFVSVTIEPDLLGVHLPIGDVVRTLLDVEVACRRKGIRLVGFWKRPYENLTSRRGFPHDFAFCEAMRGGVVAVDNSDRLRVCAYSDYALGHIRELRELRSRPEYFDVLRGSLFANIETCRGCEIEGPCRGGCFLTREYVERTGDGSAFETRCELYRRATEGLIKLCHE